jgi:transketolase
VLYPVTEKFEVGQLKVLRSSDDDQITVVAAGITVFEALSAYDQLAKQKIYIRVIDLFSIQPIDRAALVQAVQATHGRVITVEDHYAHGGLGDAVASALSELRVNLRKLAVREIPHSGTPKELVEHYGISASHIVSAVKALLAQDGELLLKSA